MGCIPSGKSKIPQFHKLKTCMHSRVPRTVIHLQTIPPVYLLITDISLLWNPCRSTSYMTVRKKYMSDIQLLMPAVISITPKPNSDAQFCLPHHPHIERTIPAVYVLLTSLLWNSFIEIRIVRTSYMTARKNYMSDIQLLMPAVMSVTKNPNAGAQFHLPHPHIPTVLSILKSLLWNPFLETHFASTYKAAWKNYISDIELLMLAVDERNSKP
jgi:hypothetical protein